VALEALKSVTTLTELDLTGCDAITDPGVRVLPEPPLTHSLPASPRMQGCVRAEGENMMGLHSGVPSGPADEATDATTGCVPQADRSFARCAVAADEPDHVGGQHVAGPSGAWADRAAHGCAHHRTIPPPSNLVFLFFTQHSHLPLPHEAPSILTCTLPITQAFRTHTFRRTLTHTRTEPNTHTYAHTSTRARTHTHPPPILPFPLSVSPSLSLSLSLSLLPTAPSPSSPFAARLIPTIALVHLHLSRELA
jgi:hypothetical protein